MNSKPDTYIEIVRGRARFIYFPIDGLSWDDIANDPSAGICFVNSKAKARTLCAQGVPAIAALGVTEGELAEFLEELGGDVILKEGEVH